MTAAPVHRRSRRRILCSIAALLPLVLTACGGDDDQTLVGYQVEPVPHVGRFTVDNASQADEQFELRADPGQLLIVFLGFTNCPDVCPTALAEVRQVMNRLGDDADPLDVAMLTVDPARDTADVLTNFVRGFVERGTALRTDDPANLQQIANAFGATFDTGHDHDGITSQVGHTDQTYLVNDNGDVIVTWTAEMTTDDLENDLRILLDDLPD